jgi:23S rRNA (uracil1939-C5)-methyltransferase
MLDNTQASPGPQEGAFIEAQVTGLAHGGAGVARVEGLVVFVRGGLPGDTVRARVRARKRAFAEADAVEILLPSPQRVPPVCAHFGACGGCHWMDLAYDAQLAHKQAQVTDCLSRIGGLESVAMRPIVPSPRALGYRNKMEFSFDGEESRLIAGLHRADDPSRIEPIRECHLQDPAANRILAWTVSACREARFSGSRDPSRPGALRRLILRRGSDGRFLVIFDTRVTRFPEGVDLARRLSEAFPEVSGVVHTSAAAEDAGPATVLAGEGTLREEGGGLVMKVTAGAFLQVNPEQAAQLYRQVEAWADPGPDDTLLDLFCGAGAITLRLAGKLGRATGVESSAEAVRCAEENARANDLANCTFLHADAPRAAVELARAGHVFDLLVVNPPRAGLTRDLVHAAGYLAPKRAVYVSCDPATLARDLAWLRDEGLRATDAAPFDMFPHTWHVETVVRLERAA